MSTTAALLAEADRLAAMRNDPRTAAIVRRAWLRPCAITPRRLMALEEAASPLLTGDWPSSDPARMAQDFCTAWAIVFPDRDIPAPAGLVAAIAEMAAQMSQAFSTVMPMRFPRTLGAPPTPTPPPDGIGWIPRTLARLGPAAIDTPLDQIFILLAATAATEGSECTGEDYRERLSEGEVEGLRRKSGAGVPPAIPTSTAAVVVLGPVAAQPEQEDKKPEGRENHRDGGQNEKRDHEGTIP